MNDSPKMVHRSTEYARFSNKMGLKQERERIYLDMRGRKAPESKSVMKQFPIEMINNAGRDIKQYERYKKVLGDSIGSLAEFGQIKYNDSDKWELFQSYVESVKTGMISPLSGFKNYFKIHQEINKSIVGINTICGTKITMQSKHFMERVIGTMSDPKTKNPRSGVTVGEIGDALKNPLDLKAPKIDRYGRKSQKYIGEKATVSINPDDGLLVQCNPTDSDLVRRLRGVQI